MKALSDGALRTACQAARKWSQSSSGNPVLHLVKMALFTCQMHSKVVVFGGGKTSLMMFIRASSQSMIIIFETLIPRLLYRAQRF